MARATHPRRCGRNLPPVGMNDFAGDRIQGFVRDGVVDEPFADGLPAVQGPPGEKQGDGLGKPHGLGQSHGPAPARNDAEFHFRQAELRFAAVVRDAIPAGECEFEPAAQARTGNQGHRRYRQSGQIVEDLLSLLDELPGFIWRS